MANSQPVPRLADLSASALKYKLHADIYMAALNLPEPPRHPGTRRHLSNLSVNAMRECLAHSSSLTAGPSRRPWGGGPPASPQRGGGPGGGAASTAPGRLPLLVRGMQPQQACLQEDASYHVSAAAAPPIGVPLPDDPFTSLTDLMEAMDLESHAGGLPEYSRGVAGAGAAETGAGTGVPEGGAEGTEARAAVAGPEGLVLYSQCPAGRPALTCSVTHHTSRLYQQPAKSRLELSTGPGLFTTRAASVPASSLGTDAGGLLAHCVVCLDRVPALLVMPCKVHTVLLPAPARWLI